MKGEGKPDQIRKLCMPNFFNGCVKGMIIAVIAVWRICLLFIFWKIHNTEKDIYFWKDTTRTDIRIIWLQPDRNKAIEKVSI